MRPGQRSVFPEARLANWSRQVVSGGYYQALMDPFVGSGLQAPLWLTYRCPHRTVVGVQRPDFAAAHSAMGEACYLRDWPKRKIASCLTTVRNPRPMRRTVLVRVPDSPEFA